MILIGCTPGMICSLVFIHKLKKSELTNDKEETHPARLPIRQAGFYHEIQTAFYLYSAAN